MAEIVYSGPALDELERVFEFLAANDPAAAGGATAAVIEAIALLTRHPLIGPRREGECRELVISYGRTGYVALYRYLPALEVVRVLRIRHQRELDYPD
ncbi:MAG: type II toxin-antitoxin system RelE/ParE family toxin [Proteobacteria bacterium]|nr:type II toxin-antitoxin system RelE/ParE family toxin [Pseudomonadota bacterium]